MRRKITCIEIRTRTRTRPRGRKRKRWRFNLTAGGPLEKSRRNRRGRVPPPIYTLSRALDEKWREKKFVLKKRLQIAYAFVDKNNNRSFSDFNSTSLCRRVSTHSSKKDPLLTACHHMKRVARVFAWGGSSRDVSVAELNVVEIYRERTAVERLKSDHVMPPFVEYATTTPSPAS